MNQPTVEQVLQLVQEKAALLKFMALCAAGNDHQAGTREFNGMAEVCRDIEDLAARVERSLDPDVLNQEMDIEGDDAGANGDARDDHEQDKRDKWARRR